MSFDSSLQVHGAKSLTKNDVFTIELSDLAKNPLNWHKIEIEDVFDLSRNVVLKCIAEHTKPFDLIPIGYTKKDKGAYFYVRNSFELIQALCYKHILAPNKLNNEFKIKITLKYCTTNEVQISLSENITAVLQKRFQNNCLNLNSFSEDQDLSEFWLLAQQRQLAFVIHIARRVCASLQKLTLANNEIQTLDALEVLSSESLTSLDLRNNAITDLLELKHLSKFYLKELFLEDNPVCNLFSDQIYIQKILTYCPYIEKIDGFLIRQNGFPSFRRNFSCNTSTTAVIDQFLSEYFTAYEFKEFDKLVEFYHQSCHYTLRILHLGTITYSFTQRDAIMSFFNSLPWWEHDQYSFTVDVILHSEERCILVLTGVLRQLPSIKNILSFNRCFTFEIKNDKFQITNEQVLIYETSKTIKENAFKKGEYIKTCPNDEEKNTIRKIFTFVSNLSREYSEMFLEECSYNLKHALVLFTDLYQNDKIPDEECSDSNL